MAGAKTDYLENKILDHILGGADYARPASVYVAMFTSAPSDSGGGTEVAGAGYARAGITNNSLNFPPAALGQKSNAAAVQFPQASAAWGSIVAVGIFDHATGGNLLYYAVLVTPKTVASGDAPFFAAGSLVFTED